MALAKVLPQCSALTKLDLRRNEITDAGAQALANALPQCGLEVLIFVTTKSVTLGRRHWPCAAAVWIGGPILDPTKSVSLGRRHWPMRCRRWIEGAVSWFQPNRFWAQALANAPPQCGLKKLSLSNQIGDSGASTGQCAAAVWIGCADFIPTKSVTLGRTGQCLPQCGLKRLNLNPTESVPLSAS